MSRYVGHKIYYYFSRCLSSCRRTVMPIEDIQFSVIFCDINQKGTDLFVAL
jgi:hypothetical protein